MDITRIRQMIYMGSETILLMLLIAAAAWDASGDIICQERKTDAGAVIEIATPSYAVKIDPKKAGSITSWAISGTKCKFEGQTFGIGNFGRHASEEEFRIPYEYEIRKYARTGSPELEKLELILKSGAANINKFEGLEFTKTLVFSSDSPYVQISLAVTNNGGPTNLQLRAYNDLKVSRGGAEVFQKGASRLLRNPQSADKWEKWRDAGEGWGGICQGDGMCMVVKSSPELTDEIVNYAGREFAGYETCFKPCLLDTGEKASLGDLFIMALEAGSAEDALRTATSEKVYSKEIRRIAETKPAKRKNEVVFSGDSRRILVVGHFGRLGMYLVTDALAKFPASAGKTDLAVFYHSDFYPGPMYGFPVSASRLGKYKAIIFIDTPHQVLSDESWDMVEQFAKTGGSVVFVGDHAADYDGKKITEIMPVRFDATKLAETATRRKIMNDRSGYADLTAANTGDPLTAGLNFDVKPQACVHRSVPRRDAVVHMKSGRWPVLTSWKVGVGTVYSFPVCLTDRTDLRHGGDSPEFANAPNLSDWDVNKLSQTVGTERAKSIFLWGDYANLWDRIVNRAIGGDNAPCIQNVRMSWTDGGKKLNAEFDTVNIPADAMAVLSVKVPDEKDRLLRGIPLNDGKGAVQVQDLPTTGGMKYVLDIVKGDQTLARRNGPVCISRPASFNLLLGHHKGLVKVYRRDVDIPYEIDFQNGANGRLGLHLTDPWGKEIWKGEIEPQGFKTGRIPLKGLALGHYKVKAVLGDEIQTAGFDIFENPNWREVFYITPNGGALDTDSPEELAAKFKTMADAGITRHGATDPWRLDMLLWPGRHLRMTGDIVLRTGMQTGHADYLIGAGGWAIAPHKTYEQVRAAMQQSRKVFDYEWGMAPDTQIYIYDEPGHYDCSLCEAAYLKRYGGKLPKEKTDPGYYRLMKMKGEAFIEALKLQCQVRKEVWPENTFFWGLTNEGGLLMEESLFMGRAFGGFGLDFFLNSQKGWQHQYGADVALAASDFNPESMAFQIEADSFRGAVPVAEQRGQSMYNCLARGCRTVVWWDWGLSRYKHDTGINTRRYECVKKVTLEALKLGPVLAGMKRPQGRIAMLTPNATRILGGGADAEQSRNVLVMSYKAAQVACGNIDFLYYQHLREGKLDGYKLMLLAGNDWIDEEMLDIIGKWVDAGGTLLVMPKSGNLSEELRPTRYFTEVCPVKYGEKSGTAEVKGFPGKMLFACGMESPSGEIAYSYADGKPAAYRFGKGKGLVEVFGFVPATARDLEKIFTDLKHDPVIVRCDDNDASAVLLKSGESHYCVAINSEDKAKDVELRMRIAGDGVPVALDMLTGKQIGAVRDGGTVKMRISLEPFWGRAIALLPGKPERLALEMPDKAQTGKEYVYRVRVLDSNGNLIAGRLPLEISVTDASGEVRTECGGYHVTENGVYEKKIRLGTNEPVGEWKIDVKAPWGGFKAGKLFKIVN